MSLKNFKKKIHTFIFPNNAQPNWKGLLNMFAALAVVLPLVYLLGLDSYAITFVLTGAIISQILSLKLPLNLLLRLNILSIIIIGISFITAGIGLMSPWVALLLLLAWIFLLSILNILGKAPGTLGFMGVFLFFYGSIAIVNYQATPLQWGLYASFGAFISSLVIIIPKFLQKDRAKREIVASCLLPDANLNTIMMAQKLVSDTISNQENTSLVAVGGLLVAARFQAHSIESELSGKIKEYFQDYLAEVDYLSRNMAESVIKNDKNHIIGLENLEAKFKLINDFPGTDPEFFNAKKLAKGYLNIFLKAQDVLMGKLVIPLPPNNFSSDLSAWENIKANLNINNMYIRHGIRFSLAVGIAFVLYLITQSHNIHWIALSIFVVLKPDLISTKERMIKRVIATIIGVVLALIIANFFIFIGWPVMITVMILIMMAFIVLYYNISYLHMAVAATMLIIFILPMDKIMIMGGLRVLDVLIGSTIAFVVSYVVLPTRLKVNLPQLLADRLNSTREYVLKSSPPMDINNPEILIAVREIARTHNNLKAGIQKLKDSYDDIDDDVSFYQNILNSVDKLSGDFTALTLQTKNIKITDEDFQLAIKYLADLLGTLEESIKLTSKVPPEIDFNYANNMIENMKKDITNEEYMVAFKYLEWIISDIKILYGLIQYGSKIRTFDRYKDV
ncbi:MAG: hypothetical protein CVV28_03065 [Methanobacteriales archaeon HGW-Methanobacteriales-1]|jgi:uncharacterized membrane protein YccC|nr:MAG: hypothetical protein CVV28_03065 [Methanobacteriales archaeon HGW-Methanobacteriales-1]